MALEKKIEMVSDLLEAAKSFFVDLLRPDMTLEKISEVVSPRLDDTIKKYERNGLKYSAGKFSIEYADESHFQLEFEMYFQDAEGKWHKCANESDLRDASLLEAGAWKTIQALKIITFPIEKPKSKDDEVLQKDKKLEAYKKAEIDKLIAAPAEVQADDKTIDIESNINKK